MICGCAPSAAARCSPCPGLGLAFDIAYDTVLATVARRDRLDAAIAAMAADSEFTPVVTRLGCLRGVSTLTAFGLAVEIGDWHRLTGRSIGAYLGLVPTESSSGGVPVAGIDHQDRQRPRPPAADRSGLASPHSPTGVGAELRRRQDAADPAARDRGQRANRRLHARWAGFDARRKRAVVANTAIARELAGWCWSLAVLGLTRSSDRPRSSVVDRLSPLVGVNIVRPRCAAGAAC